MRNMLIVLAIVVLAGILYKMNVLPQKYYYNSDFGIETYKSKLVKWSWEIGSKAYFSSSLA